MRKSVVGVLYWVVGPIICGVDWTSGISLVSKYFLRNSDVILQLQADVCKGWGSFHYNLTRCSSLYFFFILGYMYPENVDTRGFSFYKIMSFFEDAGWWYYAAVAMSQFSVEVDMAKFWILFFVVVHVFPRSSAFVGFFGWFCMVDMMSSHCMLGRGDDFLLSLQQPW